MLKKKINSKLMLAFSLAVIICIVITSLISVKVAGDALREETFNKLSGLRIAKAAEIESYFSTINNQLITFAHGKTVVQAMGDFRKSFHSADDELKFTSSQVEAASQQNNKFYHNAFKPSFVKKGGDQSIVDGLVPETKSDVGLLQSIYVTEGKNENTVDAQVNISYNKHHKNYHPIFTDFLNRFGYYDIFLIDADSGEIVYTVFKEIDYGTSLLTGPYANTNFGDVFRKARTLKENDVAIVDFESYVPSYMAPASFVATPIFVDGEVIGVLAFQMPVDKINQVMTGISGEKTKGFWPELGLGESVSIYMVGKDYRVKNEMRLWLEKKEVALEELKSNGYDEAILKHIHENEAAFGVLKYESPASENAFLQDAGTGESKSLLGENTFASFAKLKLHGLQWAMICEISQTEALEAISHLQLLMLISALILIVVAVFASYLFARRISRPIIEVTAVAKALADGDLTNEVKFNSEDEIGQLSEAINTSIGSLSNTIKRVKENSDSINSSSNQVNEMSTAINQSSTSMNEQATSAAAATEELSVNIKTIADSALMMSESILQVSQKSQSVSGNMNSVAAAVEESQVNLAGIASSCEQMSVTVDEIAHSAEDGRNISAEAVSSVERAQVQVGELSRASLEINEIIGVIEEISEQTKNLALNATIEAARAGEAGKGFAVVANEVKELARQTSTATTDIRQRIEQMQASSTGTVQEIGNIQQVIGKVNELVTGIASAVEEQSITLRVNAQNTNEAAEGMKEVAKNVAESNTAVSTISQNIEDVTKHAEEVKGSSGEAALASQEVSKVLQGINQVSIQNSDYGSQISSSAAQMLELAADLDEMMGSFKVS
ncbi:MAG: HAMP domain-containing protein [Lentisphaeraceae bacterium]|nr:HAMP domain-containing protein [Lentisphaeraceae bacterium]